MYKMTNFMKYMVKRFPFFPIFMTTAICTFCPTDGGHLSALQTALQVEVHQSNSMDNHSVTQGNASILKNAEKNRKSWCNLVMIEALQIVQRATPTTTLGFWVAIVVILVSLVLIAVMFVFKTNGDINSAKKTHQGSLLHTDPVTPASMNLTVAPSPGGSLTLSSLQSGTFHRLTSLATPGLMTTPFSTARHVPLPAAGRSRTLPTLCAARHWMDAGSHFRVRIEELPIEADALNDFSILSRETLTPVFHASVGVSPAQGRMLLISKVGQCTLLASAIPRTHHAGHVSPDFCTSESGCVELLIRNQANDFWGTFSVESPDSYALTHLGQSLLKFYGDRESRSLRAIHGSEIVAQLDRIDEGQKQYLDVGLSPHVDPILILLCFLGTAIFNPGGDLNGTDVESEMHTSKSFGT